MADETTNVSATEQMSICIRFVNSNMEVCSGPLAGFPRFQIFSSPYWLHFRRPNEKTVIVVFRR